MEWKRGEHHRYHILCNGKGGEHVMEKGLIDIILYVMEKGVKIIGIMFYAMEMG